MTFPVEGALILLLNRLMRCKSQCSRKMAASQQGRGKPYLGNQRPGNGLPTKELKNVFHLGH
jgi:hypothetical protein